MNGSDLITALVNKFGASSRLALSRILGVSRVALSNWEHKRRSITPLQVANIVKSAREAGAAEAQRTMIRPIVEFYPLKIVASLQGEGKKFRLFPTGRSGTKYTNGLKEQLQTAHGVYIFYDSRGRALYAGKAKKQTLWKEMTRALNRARDAQTVYRVRHPSQNIDFKASDEKQRQPRMLQLKLHEMAAYISAYDVSDGSIDSVEALLVRGFANDLLNVRMEKF